MLSLMRKHARSWFIKVLLGSIIIVFIFFYGFNLRQRAASLIAKVNGTRISLREFQAQYQRLLQAQQERSSEITPETARLIKETALSNLIDQLLVLEQAERWDLDVSEAEVREYIRNIPAFQRDGQFSYPLLQEYLRLQGRSEKDFVEDLTRFLLIQKTEDLIRDSATVSDEDVKALYRLFNDRIIVEYATVEPEPFEKAIELSSEEVKEYFEQHVEAYRIPEMVVAAFLEFDPKEFLEGVEVSAREIQERYDLDQERWRESKRARVRQILLRTTEDEDPKARMKVLQKAENLISRIQKGESFEKMAQEFSQDLETASKGGLMGWVQPGDLPEALDRAIFEQLSPGQVSQRPLKSPEGFHILKLEKISSERLRPLSEVRDIIEKEIRQEKSRQKASETAEKAFMTIFRGAAMREAAESLGIPLKTTPPFPRQGPAKGLEVGSEFREAAFSLKDQEDFSDVVEDGGRFYVIQLLKRMPSRNPELKEVEGRVREDLRRVKAVEKARDEARAFIRQVQEAPGKFADLAKQKGWTVTTSPSVGRLFQQGGLPSKLIQDAFSLAKGRSLLPEPYPLGRRYLVARVKERIPSDPKGLEGKEDLYRSMLLRENRESMFLSWLGMLRERSEIKTYKTYEEML